MCLFVQKFRCGKFFNVDLISGPENREMDSIVECEDHVSKSISRPSRNQGSSNEDMSEKSALNSRHSETNPKTKEQFAYRYPYMTTFSFKKSFVKKIPVLSNIIGMRCAKEISICVSFIGLVMIILYSLKDPTKGNNSENTVSKLLLFKKILNNNDAFI